MAIQVFSQQDFKRIPVIGLVPESSTAAPTDPVNGQLWFDETAGKLKFRQGASWVTADANTVYSVMSQAEAEAGTATSSRVVTAQRLNQAIQSLSPVKSVAGKTGVVTLVKADVGLGNVDNTSDAAKPISTATQTALNAKAPINNPTFTGTVTVPTPTGVSHAATKKYVDDADLGVYAAVGTELANKAPINNPTFTGAVTVPAPTANTHATTKQYVDSVGTVLGTAIDAKAPINNPTFTGSVTVPYPFEPYDAATKGYVDTAIQGLDIKESVQLATTANLSSLSGNPTIDGSNATAGERILVKNQTDAKENGIYLVSLTGPWVRAPDFTQGKVSQGAFVFVERGNTQADTGWVLTNDSFPTIGTTPLTFTQFSGAGSVDVGTGLTKSGNTISVNFAASGTSSSTQAVRADDSRLSNARTPTAHTHPFTEITGTAAAAQIPNLPTSKITSGTFDIARLPTPSTGTASQTQVVRGNDPRLTDSRTPTTHTHPSTQITDAGVFGRSLLNTGDKATARTRLGYVPLWHVASIPALTAGVWTTVYSRASDTELISARVTTISGKETVQMETRIDAGQFQVRSDVAVPASTLALYAVFEDYL